jgi:tetratricopeptide (TPR) repeat protein
MQIMLSDWFKAWTHRFASALAIAALVTAMSASAPRIAEAQTATGTPSVTATNSSPAASKADVDRLQGDVEFLRILVFVLLGGGFLVGLVTTVRSDSRSTELHHLAIAGESAVQDRAEQVHTTFLDASQKTIALVNQTLQLAKDASQRADEAAELRAQRVRDRIETRARDIAGTVVAKTELHSIVKDQKDRLRIVDLASEIASVQGYLEMEGITLSPACHFVLGLSSHFQEDSLRAIRHLRDAADEAQHRDLEIASLYWAAYELNNTGEYDQAGDLFRRASETEPQRTARFYELMRMIYETRFFALADSPAQDEPRHSLEAVDDLFHELDSQLDAIPKGIDTKLARAHLRQTQAHLLVWAADPPRFTQEVSDEQHATLERAKALFASAMSLEKSPELWTVLGLAETQYHLDGTVDTEAYCKVIDMTKDELATRVERRTLVSLDEARLIAQVRLRKPSGDIERTHEHLVDNLKILDHHMHVFSHFQKCNLSWERFKKELDDFWRAYKRPPGYDKTSRDSQQAAADSVPPGE